MRIASAVKARVNEWLTKGVGGAQERRIGRKRGQEDREYYAGAYFATRRPRLITNCASKGGQSNGG